MYARRGGSGRTLVLATVAIGILGLWLRSGGEPIRLSGWRMPGGPVGAAAVGAPLDAPLVSGAPALSGVAQQRQQGQGLPGDPRPQGNPLQASNTVMTQGYGVGTHAPANIWGAIDLAIDGDGDGAADPDGSWNQPIYATHSGVVTVTPDSHPAGNHIWIVNDAYRTGYAHLAGFAVSTGQTVNRGDLIGYLGSTGMSSGPHLDYQVWVKESGVWVNVNPLDFGALP